MSPYKRDISGNRKRPKIPTFEFQFDSGRISTQSLTRYCGRTETFKLLGPRGHEVLSIGGLQVCRRTWAPGQVVRLRLQSGRSSLRRAFPTFDGRDGRRTKGRKVRKGSFRRMPCPNCSKDTRGKLAERTKEHQVSVTIADAAAREAMAKA
jgi:hypothetical protein